MSNLRANLGEALRKSGQYARAPMRHVVSGLQAASPWVYRSTTGYRRASAA